MNQKYRQITNADREKFSRDCAELRAKLTPMQTPLLKEHNLITTKTQTPTHMKTKHTPTPWVLTDEDTFNISCVAIEGGYGDPVCHVENWALDNPEEAEANAEHIVKCVNAHDELVAVIEKVMTSLTGSSDCEELYGDILEPCRAILAKLEGHGQPPAPSVCSNCGHSAEDHESDDGDGCWNGSGCGNRCGCVGFQSEGGAK